LLKSIETYIFLQFGIQAPGRSKVLIHKIMHSFSAMLDVIQ